MAGNNKANPLTGLFQGIENLKNEVSQLFSELKMMIDEYRVVGNRKS